MLLKIHRNWPSVTLLSTLLLACGGSGEPDPSQVAFVPGEPDPGSTVAVKTQLQALADLDEEAANALLLNADEVRESYTTSFSDELGYDPADAQFLDEILEKAGWGTAESARADIEARGFAISKAATYPSFARGYSEIYMADLPVYITADMILEATYRSHDKILQQLELNKLRPLLKDILLSLRARLIEQVDSLTPEAASDLNVYLGVALSLLNDGKVASGEPDPVNGLVKSAMKASGISKQTLFGIEREMDFSQFQPRGHYAGDKQLESYFRAMIWLGRIDFRLIETLSNGKQVLRRNQVEAMVALRSLFDDKLYQKYLSFDEAITAFVGEHDYMQLQQVDGFIQELGSGSGIEEATDQELADTLVSGQYGEQRIASHVMQKDGPGGTFPLNVSFALLGQRYTVDSHIFSKVVYDRLPTRVLPNPLDVGFAALGNNQALSLLGDELDTESGLPGALASMRLLVDSHPESYWESSFYTSWLSALRALSPGDEEGLPSVAKSDAWGRRVLNTQLSSWAQLRHNNVLYVKQSYTSNAACEYPDAYVEPYPAFFTRMVELAERGMRLVTDLGLEGDEGAKISAYFQRMRDINLTLAEMASLQRSGEPHSTAHMEFINRAVKADVNCDGTILGHTGWYADLHFEPLQAVELDPSITDVHTDIGGDLPKVRPPSVLHVGTGMPRLMVVTVDSCSGPRAYAGVVSSFHEKVEEGLVRLSDEDWKEQVYNDPQDVPWMTPILSEQ